MVEIIKVGDKIQVKSPYNPDFPEAAKRLNGRWDGSVWVFDVRDEQRVRELCQSIYGQGLGNGGEAMVTVRIWVGAVDEQSYWRFGRQILNRPARDSRVRLGEGVVILEGDFPVSGGSRRYPRIRRRQIGGGKFIGEGRERKWIAGEDTTPRTLLEIRDVPQSLVEADDEEYEIVAAAEAEPTAIESMLKVLRPRFPGQPDERIVLAALTELEVKLSAI
jgi:hypothetical protein